MRCVIDGEELSCHSNKTESVSLRKCPYDQWLTNKAYLSAITVRNIYQVFTYKMAAKISWHSIWNKITPLSLYVYNTISNSNTKLKTRRLLRNSNVSLRKLSAYIETAGDVRNHGFAGPSRVSLSILPRTHSVCTVRPSINGRFQPNARIAKWSRTLRCANFHASQATSLRWTIRERFPCVARDACIAFGWKRRLSLLPRNAQHSRGGRDRQHFTCVTAKPGDGVNVDAEATSS